MIIHICKYCSNEFREYASNKRMFCSRLCYTQYLHIYPNRPMLGKKHSLETKKLIGIAFKGKSIKEETKLKIRNNNAKYWLGKKRDIETITKISKKLKGRFTGNESPVWKGNNISYGQSHKRVYLARGKANLCEVCGLDDKKRKYDWANLTGNYTDVCDYKMMCKSCHKLHDNRRRL